MSTVLFENARCALLSVRDINRTDERFRHRYTCADFVVAGNACVVPIVVIERDDAYCIVDGFRRFDSICRQAERVPALLLDSAADDASVYAATLAVNACTYASVFDKAYAVHRGKSVHAMCDDVALTVYAHVCGCALSWKVVDAYARICELPASVQVYFSDRNASLKTLAVACGMNPDDVITLVSTVFSQVQVSDSECRHIMELVGELMQRDQCSCDAVLARETVSRCLADRERTGKEIGRCVYGALKEERYPLLARLSVRERELKRHFADEKRVQCALPDNYERDYAQLTVTFKTVEELRAATRGILAHCDNLTDELCGVDEKEIVGE